MADTSGGERGKRICQPEVRNEEGKYNLMPHLCLLFFCDQSYGVPKLEDQGDSIEFDRSKREEQSSLPSIYCFIL